MAVKDGGTDLLGAIALAVMAALVGALLWYAGQRPTSAERTAEIRAETERLARENDELEQRLRDRGVQVDPIELED